MAKRYKQYIALCISMIIIAVITGIPLFISGVGGDPKDMAYHLLRIESVRDALVNRVFPPRLNPLFFNGYGYASSIFYPDVFLVIPALLNICGVSLFLSYKIFVLLIAMIGTCTTFFSLKFICGDWRLALAGSFALMLSTFYLADINSRAGLSEYLACVFVPILIAGIYDYFSKGEHVYLFGAAFLGMALSHTIMTFIGILITIFIFVVMLFIPGKKTLVFEPGRFKRLFITAVVTVLSASYYILPMLEQLVSDLFQFSDPWAQIGDYTQTISSFFKPVGGFMYIAEFGVGIPVLLLVAGRVFLGKLKNKWADFFVILGVFLLLAMTDILPWRLLERTQLNMIQFTFRFYPYALCFLVFGMSIAYSEKKKGGLAGRCFVVFIIVVSAACGLWESIYCCSDHAKMEVNDTFIHENSYRVSAGEWLPLGVPEAVQNGQGSGMVIADDIEIPWTVKGYNNYTFSIDENSGCVFTLPLIYYKGYQAEVILPNGNRQHLQIVRSGDGLVRIELQQKMNGVIEVKYYGTAVQRISDIISVVALLGIAVGFFFKKYRGIRTQNGCAG